LLLVITQGLRAEVLELSCNGQMMLAERDVQPMVETIIIDTEAGYLKTALFESYMLNTEPIRTAFYLIIHDRLNPDSLGTYFYMSRNSWKYNYSLVMDDGNSVQVVGRCELAP
jgi:hypothetical protein